MKRKILVTMLVVTICMSLFTLPAFASVTDDNPYNIALGKTVTDVNNAVAYAPNVPNLVNGDSIDSNKTVAIKSGSLPNAVIEIDLKGTYAVSGVDVLSGTAANGSGSGHLKEYQIHYLSDEEWIPAKIAAGMDIKYSGGVINERVTILSDGCTVNCNSGNNMLVFDENVKTNKIRIVSKHADKTTTNLREIRVYKADENNVAYRKPVTVNWDSFGAQSGGSTVQQLPSFVVDGQNNNTLLQQFMIGGSKANTTTTDYWMEIDLLKDYNINKAVVSTGTSKNFKFQAYVNNEWVDIPGASVENNTVADKTLTFPVYTANKVRLFLPKSAQTSHTIKEIKIYAVDDIVVNEFGYKNNGETMKGLIENATFVGSMNVTNNTNSPKNVTFVSALYETVNGSYQLKDVDVDTKPIAKSGASATLETSIKIPENADNCVLKTFLFDDMVNIMPYFGSDKFSALTKDVLKVDLKNTEDNQWMPDTATVKVTASYGKKNVKNVELYLNDSKLDTTYENGLYYAKLPKNIEISEHTLYAKAIGEDDTSVTTDIIRVNVYDSSKIVVKQTNNNIDFYIKGSDENSNRYVKHTLKRSIYTANEGKDLGGDLWRLFGSYDVERTGKFDFVDTYAQPFVVRGVEWECALQIADKAGLIPNKSDDFIGGYHKNEFVIEDSIVAKYDGVVVDDLTKKQDLLVDKIEFAEESNMYVNQKTDDDLLAVHTKNYEITVADGIKVVQGFDWRKSVELKNAYTTMLPILRQLDDGTQITDKAIRDDNANGLFDDTVYDVTYGKNSTLEIGKAANGIYASKIWSEESGISAEVTVSYDPVIAGNDFFVSMYTENNGYNKLYFDYCSNYVPQVGETWNVATTYKFDINK